VTTNYRAEPTVADLHQVGFTVPNFTRITVPGKTAKEWVKLSIDPQAPQVFTSQRIQLP
jgi:hypothetical protein